MKEYITYIAKSLVDKPEAVEVTETETDQGTVLELRVDREDLGKVIGRQGRMAKVLRTVLSAASAHAGQRTLLEIIE